MSIQNYIKKIDPEIRDDQLKLLLEPRDTMDPAWTDIETIRRKLFSIHSDIINNLRKSTDKYYSGDEALQKFPLQYQLLKKAYLTKQGATRINDEIVERKIGDILEKRLDDRKVQNEIIKNARNEILEAPFNPLKMDLEYEKKRKAIPPVMPTLNTNLNSGQGISLFSPFNNVDINKIKPIVPTYMDIAEINSREPVKYGSQMDDLTKSFGSLGLVQKSIVQPTYNFDPNQYKMDVDDDNRDNKRKKIGSSFGGKKTKRRKSKRRKYSKKRKLSRKRRHTKRRR